ncbi:hypothetical protein LSM04_008170 [Trypanosoma melophagium]|uniref:uncharacterized protein n=1 Tax=Trypanosoma melophagium TaxID=715481 RepID=UPI00351A1305|nr:hypothetical protein LSM04_008170 [Trypanosoma melophagium]
MSTESELQAKYDAAVKDWKAAKKAREATEEEWDEKWELAEQQPDGTREYYIACAEYWNADIIWSEKCEQEWALECKKCEIAVYLMVHQHGVDSKAAQIAKFGLELVRTKGVQLDGVRYLTNWYRLRCKGWLLYYQLKAAGCVADANEVERAINQFENHISNDSSGKAFNEAWDMATAALDKWEETNDRTDWDAAKPKYDTELEKWNAFNPKGDEYAKALESKINECINKTLPTAFILYGLSQTRIQNLEEHIGRKTKDICELKCTMGAMAECIDSLAQGIQTLIRAHCQYIAESEATARTAVEQEWQMWFEHTMAERRTLERAKPHLAIKMSRNGR